MSWLSGPQREGRFLQELGNRYLQHRAGVPGSPPESAKHKPAAFLLSAWRAGRGEYPCAPAVLVSV